MRRRARSFAAGLGLLGAACAVGPDYVRPAVPVPPAYKEEAQATGTESAEWKPARPVDEAARGKWWEVFGDPELDRLEEQVGPANPTIAQAEAAFRSARAAVRGARADYLPTMTAAASITRARSSANAAAAPAGASGRTTTSYALPIDLSYEADVWGRVRRSVESGVAGAQASAADLESVRLAMTAELAVDYYELRGLDGQKELLDAAVTAYEKAVQLTVNRHDQGVASGVDVAQAQTQLHVAEAQAADLALSRAQLEHAIAILVGRAPADFSLAPSLAAAAPPAIPAGVPSELLERRPDIAAAERRVAAANAQVGVATAAFFPHLLLAASGGVESGRLADWLSAPSRFWSIGPSLVATLLDGGRRRAEREQARASYDAAVAAYRSSVLEGFREVEDNLAALRLLAEEDDQLSDAVAAAERSVALARNRYTAGITSYLEVVTAQSAALSSERAAVDVRTQRMAASVNLVKALGGGWRASELRAIPSP